MSLQATEMQTLKPEERILPTKDPALKIKAVNKANDDDLPIFIHEKVLKEIIAYSRTDKDRELGGVLVGGFYVDSGQEFIEIESYLEASKGVGQTASFTFTHDAWSDIHERLKDDTKVLVGWHHTHPTFGCFLSSHDRFIHDNFFNLHWQVALVVDPCRNTLAFFQWRGTDVVDCGFHLIVK